MNFAFLSSILAALIGLFLFWLAPFSIWDSLNIVGPALVLIGIGREFWLLLKKLPVGSPPEMEAKKHTQEIAAALVVILGVALELIVVPHSLFEIADLKLTTVQLETTNAMMWQTNSALKRDLVALEAKVQKRRVGIEQVKNFIFLTQNFPKIPVDIQTWLQGEDTDTFAADLREMFNRSGFKPNSGAGYDGITHHPELFISAKFATTNIPYGAVIFITYSTNETVTFPSVAYETTNGFSRPIISGTNEFEIFYGIAICFNQIGIPVLWHGSADRLAPGHCAIVVTTK